MLPTFKTITMKDIQTGNKALIYEIEGEYDPYEFSTIVSILENFDNPYFLRYTNIEYIPPQYTQTFFGFKQTKTSEGKVIFHSEEIDMTFEDYLKEINDNLENSFNCKEVNRNVVNYSGNFPVKRNEKDNQLKTLKMGNKLKISKKNMTKVREMK